MRLGMAAVDTNEGWTYLKVRQLDLQVVYLRSFAPFTWTTGMLDPTWVTAASAANQVIVSVPMLVGNQSGTPLTASGSGQTASPQDPSGAASFTTMTLADVAAGVWDSLFGQVFQMIATARPAAILRIGWEEYGDGWYPWNGAALYSLYAAAYQHLVTLARTKSGSFTFDWNGNVAFATYDPTLAYPGDAYCDYMTCDVYDGFAPGGAAGWDAYRNAVLTNAVNFAISRGKPFGLSEFGTFGIGFDSGYGDDPAWLTEAYYWFRQNAAHMCWACWFNNFSGNPSTDGSGAFQRNPNMAAVFSALFGPWARELAGETTHRFVSSGVNRLRVR